MDITRYDSLIKSVLKSRIGPIKIDRSQKEDLTQECYVALLENQDKLTAPDHEQHAEKICRARIVETMQPTYAQKSKKAFLVSSDDPQIARQIEKIPIPEQGPISESQLYEAVKSLSEDDRQVIQLRFIDGLTQQQTCGKLGLTVETVKWRQKRGIAALKKYFEVTE
jgi:RNA polymerase sigma-70 factor, ECF subfamily